MTTSPNQTSEHPLTERLADLDWSTDEGMADLLISGGDSRLDLNEEGVNYIMTTPLPQPRLVVRSTSTGATISRENYASCKAMAASIAAGERSFASHMAAVHDRLRELMDLCEGVSLVTVPSGSDCEFVPVLAAQLMQGPGRSIVNILTGAGEVGSSSALAAGGFVYKDGVPSGRGLRQGDAIEGFSPVEVMEIGLRDSLTGRMYYREALWKEPLLAKLRETDGIVIFHILESSKMGNVLDILEDVKALKREWGDRLLVAVDACQSRANRQRIQEYLDAECLVMITGSKFYEGPPFSGVTLIPQGISERLAATPRDAIPTGLQDFITRFDVSGPMTSLSEAFGDWKNIGLLLRWNCALNNWGAFHRIPEERRNALIQDWVSGFFSLVEPYPDLILFEGGEIHSWTKGERNTIISLKIIGNRRLLPNDVLKDIHKAMARPIMEPPSGSLTDAQRKALERPFLIGQPVHLGRFSVLRVACGAELVVKMDRNGVDAELENDAVMLEKLSLLARFLAPAN